MALLLGGVELFKLTKSSFTDRKGSSHKERQPIGCVKWQRSKSKMLRLQTCPRLRCHSVQFDFHSKSGEHWNKNHQLKIICPLCVSALRIVMTQQSNIFITKDSSPISEKDLFRKLKCLHLLQKDKKSLPSDRRDCKKRKGRFIVKAIRFQSNTLNCLITHFLSSLWHDQSVKRQLGQFMALLLSSIPSSAGCPNLHSLRQQNRWTLST